MIIRQDKGYETRSDIPNENWTDETVFVVEDGTELAKKVIANYPYYNFSLDSEGNLIDIIPTEIPSIPNSKSTETEVLWQTVTDLQLEIILTNQSLTEAQLEIELLKGGIS